MALIHNNTLPFALDLLCANLQHTDKANLFLSFGLDTNDLTSLERMLGIRQASSRRGEAGGHERCPGEHKANSAAVDLDCRDGGGVGVDEAEMGDWRSVNGLEEEGSGVYCVEGHAVGSLVIFGISFWSLETENAWHILRLKAEMTSLDLEEETQGWDCTISQLLVKPSWA